MEQAQWLNFFVASKVLSVPGSNAAVLDSSYFYLLWPQVTYEIDDLREIIVKSYFEEYKERRLQGASLHLVNKFGHMTLIACIDSSGLD